MAIIKRKKYVIDKKFQLKTSFKAVILSLIAIIILGGVLLYYATTNNNYINDIVKSQDQMIDMFLTTPALINSKNPVVKEAENTFKNNIGMLVEIKRNSKIVLYFIIVMIILQSIIIFGIFISITHKISGPIYVMSNYLKEIRAGKKPELRPLRKKDEFKAFYNDLRETIDHLEKKKS